MVELLRDLVEIESPTGHKAGVDAVADRVTEELRDIGLQVERFACSDVGDQLLATNARAGEADPVLMLSHMDTVWPLGTLADRPFRVDDGIAYGPGAADMKAGIVVAVTALRLLEGLGRASRASVRYLLTSDEEKGSRSSRDRIEAEAKRCAVALVTEPADMPDGRIKTERKGSGMYELEVKGVESHAGAAHRDGASAISELARLVRRIDELTDYDAGTTSNVGIIEGGSARNVVAGKARAVIDFRITTDAERERIRRYMEELRPDDERVALRVRGGFERPPMQRTPASRRAYGVAVDCAEQLGFALPETSSGGASDGNFTSAMGVPTLDGLGAVGAGIHAVDERVDVGTLGSRAALIAGLMLTLPSEFARQGTLR